MKPNHKLGIGLIFVFFCLFFPSVVKSKDSKGDSTEIKIRTFHEYFYVKAIQSQKIFDLTFSDDNIPDQEMIYKANVGNYLGFGVFIFDLGLDVLFRIPPGPESNALYGDSKARDWQIHAYSRKIGADLSYQEYQGFYLENPANFYPDWQSGDPHPRQEDMKARIINLGLIYVFRSNNFSFPSVFNQTEAQLKSGGSWFLTGLANSSVLSHPTSIIPEVEENEFTGLKNLRSINASSLNVLPGYSYNIIIKRKVYINLSLALGFGYQLRSYSTETTSYQNNSIEGASTWRLGAGYNGRRFFIGVNGYFQNNSSEIENLNIRSSVGFTKFFIGYRFREWGFMRKSVFDLFNIFSKKNKD